MITGYSKEIIINPSICDASCRLGVAQTFDVFMDTAAEHAEATDMGVYVMAKKGLGWVTVKTRIHFDEMPKMTETVKVSTWPQKIEESRCERGYSIEKGGKVIISSKTEWAVLEAKTGRAHVLMGEVYPEDLKLTHDKVLEEPFFTIDGDFLAAELLGTYKIVSTDVDLYRHMNNAKYAYALISMFSSKELMGMNIKDIQLVFKRPCYEGETIEFRKIIDGEVMKIAGIVNDKICLLARMEGNF